jgi:acetylornithine deacetylase/succinyl-diaminopimelate desuccinylase-like protein
MPRRRPGLALAAASLALAAPALVPSAVLGQESLRQQVSAWISAHQRAIVTELMDLLAIPNVAADTANIRRNAEFLQRMLRSRGFEAQLLETAGNPLVWGELRAPGATRTVLVYCQYDGQPVDPKSWKQQDPFAPVMRTGDLASPPAADARTRDAYEDDWRLYARSASDAKGPIVAFMAALDALKAQGLSPTSNLRVIMDGEEEMSSPNLVPAIERYRDRLKADLMLVFDGPTHYTGEPTLVFGARGIQTLQLTVYGPRSGVHSGNYGNWIPNPALRLAHLLASMKDDRGHVLVQGFYDDLQPLSAEEQAMIDAVPNEDERLLEAFGVAAPERPGVSLQQAFQRPTLNIRGLQSAFVGAQARTIIPDRAVAELDIRLVKETPGARMAERVVAHVRGQGYHVVSEEPDDRTRATYSHLAKIVSPRTAATAAFRTSALIPESRLVIDALTRMYGRPPVRIRTAGGTVPIAQFIDALGFPAIMVPIVNFDNNQHEENENVRLGHLFQGIVTYAAILRM